MARCEFPGAVVTVNCVAYIRIDWAGLTNGPSTALYAIVGTVAEDGRMPVFAKDGDSFRLEGPMMLTLD